MVPISGDPSNFLWDEYAKPQKPFIFLHFAKRHVRCSFVQKRVGRKNSPFVGSDFVQKRVAKSMCHFVDSYSLKNVLTKQNLGMILQFRKKTCWQNKLAPLLIQIRNKSVGNKCHGYIVL
jgi:hypothetical protein